MIRALLLFLAAFWLAASPAHADDSRPLFLTVERVGPEKFEAQWKVPYTVEASLSPDIVPPDNCSVEAKPRRWSDALGHWQSAEWICPGGLTGKSLHIAYPRANPALATVARLRLGEGGERTVLLLPQQTELDVEAQAEGRSTTLIDYIRLGVEHIWLGFDHLLFVAALIFIAGTPRRILATITGFTLSHSVTLALSALDLVRLPIRAVEAVIALSIVFLAVEIVKGNRNSLTWRYPIAVAASFGLLHGFGFAAVLREIGLPEGNFVPALLGFNLGIEIGQIVFAVALIALFAVMRRTSQRIGIHGHSALRRAIGGYPIGILASFWMIERLLA